MALRRAYDASLEDRAAGAEAERDAQARLAAAAERGRELQERRARAVDESAARLRRIERDLHDGAQVRLTALAMTLGEIKELLDASTGGGGERGRALKPGPPPPPPPHGTPPQLPAPPPGTPPPL